VCAHDELDALNVVGFVQLRGEVLQEMACCKNQKEALVFDQYCLSTG
jgi:hypothetical protein